MSEGWYSGDRLLGGPQNHYVEILGSRDMGKRTKGKKPAVDEVVRRENVPGGGSRSDSFDWRTFEPSMLPGGAEAPLAAELTTYRDRLDELLRHKGQYVVIKGKEIAGFFRDRRSAVEAAIEAYGPGPFLVKKVVDKESIRRIGHSSL
jgi:hypothetical protein